MSFGGSLVSVACHQNIEVIISPSGRMSDSSRELSDIRQNRIELGEYVIGLSMFVMT